MRGRGGRERGRKGGVSRSGGREGRREGGPYLIGGHDGVGAVRMVPEKLHQL